MDHMNNLYTTLFPSVEGLKNPFKKKKNKKKCKSDDKAREDNDRRNRQRERIQIQNNMRLQRRVEDLSEKYAQCEAIVKNDKEMCRLKLNRQKDISSRKLKDQKNKYKSQIKNYKQQLIDQAKQYENKIQQLESQIVRLKKTIVQDEISIREKNIKINQLTEELNRCRRLRTQCIEEARAAAERLGNSRANVESSIYKNEADFYILQIEQNIETMNNQCLYAYTLRDHIRSVKKDIKKVEDQIEAYIDKVNLNKRKSTYEQDVINIEEGWEIGLHIVYAAIFLGIIVYLSINIDKSTKSLKIMKPNNIAILVFLLLYPMIIYPITKYIYNGILYSIDQLPKNMYMDL